MASLSAQINWKKINGFIPAIIQDTRTKQVLMLGYMNRVALEKTLATKRVWFYSRSKKRLWMKGETSGNLLTIVSVRFDCDRDALLVRVRPTGSTCHTGNVSCFDDIFDELFEIIKSRKRDMPKKSYTTLLFKGGYKKIGEKIIEEAGEVVKAATYESKKRLVSESADLLYHLFVVCAEKDIELEVIKKELRKRRK